MIGEIEDSPQVRYCIVAWDTETNTIDYDAPGMSVFDVCGVLSVALDLASDQIPVPQAPVTTETEEDL